MTPQTAALSALLVAGCYSPGFHGGDLQCGANGSCPTGFHCAANNKCYANGFNPDLGGIVGPQSDGGLFVDMGDMGPVTPVGDMAPPATVPDMTMPPPISYPPAAVWISSGGGSGVGSSTGSKLNFSVGGAVVFGSYTGSAGGTLMFTYFSNDAVQ